MALPDNKRKGWFVANSTSLLASRSARTGGLVGFALLLTLSCSRGSTLGEPGSASRTFRTGFETTADFNGFFIVPQNHMNTASHDLSTEVVRSGQFAHKGWIFGPNPPSGPGQNNNHRGYPTVQLYKTEGGAFKTPVFIEFWVWLDMALSPPGEWFSFATLDWTTADTWDAVLVNLSDQGFVHLMHVPVNGQKVYTFQTATLKFPMKQWVKLSVALHFDPTGGYAKVWQDDSLVSSALVHRGEGRFTQAHFGLYAPPSLSNGVVYNDDLIIRENYIK